MARLRSGRAASTRLDHYRSVYGGTVRGDFIVAKEPTMALATTIEFAPLEHFYLDPLNPRLGRSQSDRSAPQDDLLRLMRSWALDELAVSFIESGFWPQEAVVVVKEELYGAPPQMVVVEGNRRIAALKFLKQAVEGETVPRSWQRLIAESIPHDTLFLRVPYVLADERSDVKAFIGFRHVTGIKQWPPTEKAQFIASLVDEQGLSYETVRKQIGSRTETVRRNYIAYRILLQIENLDIDINQEGLDQRFSVMFLSLRESRVLTFLGVNSGAEPSQAKYPVPEEKTDDLSFFSRWLFGYDGQKAIFTDSRDVGDFARILSHEDAVHYLKTSPNPSFEVALQKAGIEHEEIENQLKEANVQMELALSKIHLHLTSEPIKQEMERFALNAKELVIKFPDIAATIGLQQE